MPKLTKRSIEAFIPASNNDILWDSEVKGFGVRGSLGGNKSFVLSYRLGSRVKRVTICKVGSPYGVEQARERAAAMLRDAREGRDPTAMKQEASRTPTIGDLVDLYLDEGPALKPNKKAISWATDRSVLTRHVKPLLGAKLITELTGSDIAKFQADVAAGKSAAKVKASGRGRSQVTGGRRVAAMSTAILGAMLAFAVKTGRLKANPARGVPLLKTDSKQRFLSEQEVAAVSDALRELEAEVRISSTMADAIRLLLLTGCRRGEVLTLQWSWVDFERGCLRLPDSKTGAKVVPLGDAAVELLKERRSGVQVDDAVSLFVFPAARGEGHCVGIPRAWELVRARATERLRQRHREEGRPASFAPNLGDVRLHDLRHSFASFAIARGAPLFIVGKVLGHKQARTTELYAHLSDNPLRTVANSTADFIAGAMRPPRPTR